MALSPSPEGTGGGVTDGCCVTIAFEGEVDVSPTFEIKNKK